MIGHSPKLLSLLCVVFLIALFIGGASDGVHASPTYLSQYNAAYGTAATCSLCHTSPPTLNGTGNAFLNSGHNLASIAPAGQSTSTTATPSAPAASSNPPKTTPSATPTPSKPAQTTNPANPAVPQNPQQTTASNPNASLGSTNNGTGAAGQPPSLGTVQTSPEIVPNNPTQGSTSENTSSSNPAEKDGASSVVNQSNSESFKKGKEDSGQNREFSQPSGTRGKGDSNTNRNSLSPSRVEGNRFPKPNTQFHPPLRNRR